MKLGFVLIAPDDASRIVDALSVTEDPVLRVIAQRLKEGGARDDKPAAGPRLVSKLWETWLAIRQAAPVGLAEFLTTQKPFPGIRIGPKSTKPEMDERIETTVFCILAQPNGITSDVRRYLCEQWAIDDRALVNIIRLAAERLRGAAQPDEDLRAKVVAHGWNVYGEALRAKRPQAAVGALDGIAKNAGLTKDVEINIFQMPQFTSAVDGALDRMLTALDQPEAIAQRASLPREVVERVLAAAREELETRVGDKKAITVAGEAA